MKCPKCKLENPSTATLCDCGFDFNSKMVKPSLLSESEQRRNSKLETADQKWEKIIKSVTQIGASPCLGVAILLGIWFAYQVSYSAETNFKLLFAISLFFGVGVYNASIGKWLPWKNEQEE